MSKTYRETLVKTVVEFDEFIREVDLNIVNLAMKGEFSEVNDLFEEGDEVFLDIADFEDTNDHNVQKLIKAVHFLSEINASLRNTNAISAEETDGYDDLPF